MDKEKAKENRMVQHDFLKTRFFGGLTVFL